MSNQLSFSLPKKETLDRDNYFVSQANQGAVSLIEDWINWPSRKLILVGSEGSGKTHLGHLWASEVGATIINATTLMEQQVSELSKAPVLVEDINEIQRNQPVEIVLFHLHNLLYSEGHSLLMTSQILPGRLSFSLEDLQSRIEASTIAKLHPVDDDLLGAILIKMFADRQIYFSDKLLTYVLSRVERSYTAAKLFVEEVDSKAMAESRVIGKKLVRDILEARG
ncbi:MAG: chromosomal replication initiator DnaA [Rhodobacterales bacterium]|jgi:chromosomal replication initiation ATPase DnaA